MEWRQKRPPEEWRGYQRLGVAVIASAVQDLKKPTRAGGESVRAGESARAFLTVSNSSLKFWCRVADVDMNAILRTYCQGGKVMPARSVTQWRAINAGVSSVFVRSPSRP